MLGVLEAPEHSPHEAGPISCHAGSMCDSYIVGINIANHDDLTGEHLVQGIFAIELRNYSECPT